MLNLVEHPLRGHTVLLVGGSESGNGFIENSALGTNSLPDEPSTRIEEAVISLARAVFARGGRLAFWHDPVITPIVAGVALEYWVPSPAEGWSENSIEFSTSGRSPVLVLGEPAEWERECYESSTRIGHVVFSSEQIWSRLQPSRIVCIGGDSMVYERLAPIRQRLGRQRIFVLPTTGGAAHDLLREMAGFVDDAESAIWAYIQRQRLQMFFAPSEDSDSNISSDDLFSRSPEEEVIPEFRFALYPLVMSLILDGPEETTSSRR